MTEPETRPNPGSVWDRLDRIEARLRDYGVHDPGCPERGRERAQRDTGAWLAPVSCTCWLSDSGPGGGRDAQGEGAERPERTAGTGTDEEG